MVNQRMQEVLACKNSEIEEIIVEHNVANIIVSTNEFHAGNSYAAKYEAACRRLEDTGVQTDAESSNERLVRNGWV